MIAKKTDNWWEESKNFKKTIKEEYLDIDESLIELEKNSNIIRLELNAIELPLFSKDTKRAKNQIKIYHFKTDKTSYLEVEAPANHSIPGEFEERVFIALTKIMKNNNYNRRFIVSANEILETLGLENKSYYKRIRDALKLLTKTNYTFANSLYSNKESGIIEKQIVSSIMNITIISKKDKNSEEIELFEDGRIKEVYEISFTDYFYDNIIRRGYLAFDSEKLLSIENSVARSIYTMLEKWRGYELYIRRQVFFIARRIPLRWDKTQIKRTIDIIEKGIIELKNLNLIQSYKIIKNKKWELAEIEIIYDEIHNKTKRETFFTEKNEFNNMEMFVTSTEEKIKLIEEEKEKSDISEILKLFPEKVLSMKTFETFIKNAVEKKGFDYVKGTAEYTVLKKPKSYKSYLSKALEENWADEHIANKKSRIKQQQKNETINFVEIEEAKIIAKYSYDDFEKLSENIKNNVEIKVYESFLSQANAIDSKTMKGIFEKSKKGLIVQYMNENESIIEYLEKENKKESNKFTNEYISVTKFILEVSKIAKENNIEFNIDEVAPIFKNFGEFEDENIKIEYNLETKLGIIEILRRE